MITRKELSFINSWANKVPYPGISYCEDSMEKLQRCLKLYNDEYANVKYNISFSNNEEIEFQILNKNISHMLGIDYKSLSGEFFKQFRKDVLDFDPESNISAYDLLELILENKDKVLDYDKNNSARAINYYKVAIKCDIFNKLADLTNFNYGCINFDKEVFQEKNPDVSFSSKSTKFLYTPSDEIISPYFMMGLKKDEPTNHNYIITDENASVEEHPYIVETLIAPSSIKGLFDSQEVIIPSQILTDINGTLDKKIATPSEKIKILKEYQAIVSQYKIDNKINIYGDYLSLLMSSDRTVKKHYKRKTKSL